MADLSTTALCSIRGSTCWSTLASWQDRLLLGELTLLFLALQTRETFSKNGIYDPLNIMLCYPRALRFRGKKIKLTIQHILELRGLIQTNKKIEHNLQMEKKYNLWWEVKQTNTYKYIIYILKKWILSIVDLFIQPAADVQCSRANDLRHGNLLYCRLHLFFLLSSFFCTF